jgi:signal transduction histidine kinase
LILISLLSNAFKYSPPKSRVDLSIEAMFIIQRPGVQLRIGDRIGSAGRPDTSQMFFRYYPAQGAKTQVGAVLGLWLSQTLASQLGSELNFEADQQTVNFNFFS